MKTLSFKTARFILTCLLGGLFLPAAGQSPGWKDYASKPQYAYQGPEVHREYFKEKTVIFCEEMPEGKYTFRIALLPRYSGRYTINPAKVELMYFPVVSSNNGLTRLSIE